MKTNRPSGQPAHHSVEPATYIPNKTKPTQPNPPTNQPSEQASKQPLNQSINQSINQMSIHQPRERTNGQANDQTSRAGRRREPSPANELFRLTLATLSDIHVKIYIMKLTFLKNTCDPYSSSRVPSSKTHGKFAISGIREQPLRHFVRHTFKNTRQNYNFWNSRATLTALRASHLQKHTAKLQLLELESNPYGTSCVTPSKTHGKVRTSGIGVQPLRHFVSSTFKNTR